MPGAVGGGGGAAGGGRPVGINGIGINGMRGFRDCCRDEEEEYGTHGFGEDIILQELFAVFFKTFLWLKTTGAPFVNVVHDG